jgi:hypothetical protein
MLLIFIVCAQVADIVTSLKIALDMEFSIRKPLYVELAALFAKMGSGPLEPKVYSDVHFLYLQTRVCSHFARYFDRTNPQVNGPCPSVQHEPC